MRLLSPAAVERASQLVWEADCIMTQRRIRMGYGFMHNEPDTVPMASGRASSGRNAAISDSPMGKPASRSAINAA